MVKEKPKEEPEKEQPAEEKKSVFRHYKVVLKIRDKILGGIPWGFERIENLATQEYIKKLAADAKKVEEQAVVKKDGETPEEKPKKKWKLDPHATFTRTKDEKVCIEEKNIKGLMKECVQTLYGRGRKSTITQKLVSRAVFAYPPQIVIADEISGTIPMPVHAITPQGPRTSIQEADFVKQPTVSFTLKIAAKEITEEILKELLTLGQEIGLGAVRTLGYGKFDVVSIELLNAEGEKRKQA